MAGQYHSADTSKMVVNINEYHGVGSRICLSKYLKNGALWESRRLSAGKGRCTQWVENSRFGRYSKV